jgi:NADH dehydrogenase
MVNDYMQALEYEEVYFLGDVVWYSERQRTLPQIVETALQTAECAAHNIIGEIEKTEVKSFQSNYHGNMVSIGSKFAVADLMGMMLSGFLAMAFKHLVNLHYLFEIGGFSLCWDYLAHHFVHIKSNRSSIGGQARQKTPSYWLLPLRIFLGMTVLWSGIEKVNDGWLDPAQGVSMPAINLSGEQVLASFEGKTLIESNQSADGTTAATEWEEGGAEEAASTPSSETVTNEEWDANSAASEWDESSQSSEPTDDNKSFLEHIENLLGLFQRTPLLEAVPPYLWFADLLAQVPWLAYLLQASVVLAELAIGLALLGGLFTWLAAAAWIGLSAMFILSGWGDASLLWHMAASFAVMGGAGKVLGLDYWVIPWIRRWWSGTKLAQNTHLFMGRVPPPKTQSPQDS